MRNVELKVLFSMMTSDNQIIIIGYDLVIIKKQN